MARCGMTHTILFRRPETAHSITKMVVQTETSAVVQIRNLERLGYTIMDISPGFVGQCSLHFPAQPV